VFADLVYQRIFLSGATALSQSFAKLSNGVLTVDVEKCERGVEPTAVRHKSPPSIADRIAATVPRNGCKVKTLRCVLHDIAAAPLDYAIQGLTASGRFIISDGFIRPAPGMHLVAQSRPRAPAPFREWESLDAQLRELMRGAD
jgi:hypothetical protein